MGRKRRGIKLKLGRKRKSRGLQGVGLLLIGVVLVGAFSVAFYFFAAGKIQVGEYTLKDQLDMLVGDKGVTVLRFWPRLQTYIGMVLEWLDEITKDLVEENISVAPPPDPEVPVYIVFTFSVRVVKETVKNGITDSGELWSWCKPWWHPSGWPYRCKAWWDYEYYERVMCSSKEGDILCTITVTDTPPEGIQQVRDTNGNPIPNLYQVGVPNVNKKDFMSYSEVDINIHVSEENNPTNDLLVFASQRLKLPIGTSTFSYVFNTTDNVLEANTWLAKIVVDGYEHRYRYIKRWANYWDEYGNLWWCGLEEVLGERYITVKQGTVYETTLVVA